MDQAALDSYLTTLKAMDDYGKNQPNCSDFSLKSERGNHYMIKCKKKKKTQ